MKLTLSLFPRDAHLGPGTSNLGILFSVGRLVVRWRMAEASENRVANRKARGYDEGDD